MLARSDGPRVNPEAKLRSLRELRRAAGLSQVEVADRLGVSQQAVGKWEAANDPGDGWPRLVRVLGVSEDYLALPFGAEARIDAVEERNAIVRSAKLRGEYGKGKLPEAA